MSKRAAAREWKRKRKQQQMIFRLAVVGVCVLAVLGICYIAWDMWSRTYVMTFEGQRIGTADLRFFSAFADGTMDPREQALDQLTRFLVIEQAAQQHGIGLTAEEQAELADNAAEMRAMFEMFEMPLGGISDERMAAFMSMDVLSERLLDVYAPYYTVDEAAFASEAAEFVDMFRTQFVEMEFRYTFANNAIEANEIYSELFFAEPEEYDDIIMRHMQAATGFDPEELWVPTISLAELRDEFGISQSVANFLTTLAVGEISEPVQIDEDTFLILVVDFVAIPTDDEIIEIYREQYIMNARMDIFSEAMQERYEAADIQINQRGVNAA